MPTATFLMTIETRSSEAEQLVLDQAYDVVRSLSVLGGVVRVTAVPAPAKLDHPCELYIARQYGNEDGNSVRIEARNGAVLLARIDTTLENFAAATMGTAARPAVFSTVRNPRGRASGTLEGKRG